MSSFATAVDALASLTETRASIRAALAAWDERVDGPLNLVVQKVSRRARMGAGLATTIEPFTLVAGKDGSLVAHALASHTAHGGVPSRTLRAVAASIEARAKLLHEANAATSAGRLSARLLVGLGLTSAVLIPAWQHASLHAMAGSIAGAAFLGGLGTIWMRRLLPRPPDGDHLVAACADLVAALVDAGMPLRLSCETVLTPHGIDRPELGRALRRVRLGMGWVESLARAPDPDLRRLSHALGQSDIGRTLRVVGRELRDERTRACEIEARRATVKLVLPLTLCFLPAFGLVMAVPLMRGLTG